MKRVICRLVIEELMLMGVVLFIVHDPGEAHTISTDMMIIASLGVAMVGAKLLICWWEWITVRYQTVNPLINAGMTAAIAVVFLLAYMLLYHLVRKETTASNLVFVSLSTTLIYITGDKFFSFIFIEEVSGRRFLSEMKKLTQPTRSFENDK